MSCHHFLDHAELEIVDRPQAGEMAGQHSGEAFGTFALEDQGLGQEAVPEGVVRGALLPLRGFRALGENSVGAG
jgi:hypothetical protein